MESTLLIITIASLALTVVLAIVLTVILLDKRRRSQARVAVLAEMAAAEFASSPAPASPLDDLDDFEILPVEPVMSSGDLFTPHREPSAWPKRLAVAGAIALVVIAVAVVRPGAPRVGSSNAVSPAAKVAAENDGATHLLELLSLKHDQEANALKITGLVQNPRQGTPLTRITATAMLFGSDGTFLASGRAPLDFSTLRPGDESGFVITVPVSAPVARYRVGFRAEDGRIIGHVDRRLTGTIARGAS
jgi:hypothetical protein